MCQIHLNYRKYGNEMDLELLSFGKDISIIAQCFGENSMSGVSKRLHEEATHPATSKHLVEDTSVFHNNNSSLAANAMTSKQLIEDTSVYHNKNISAKLIPSVVVQEYHPPLVPNFELGPDSRLAKMPRSEPRGDAEMRSNLMSIHRISSSKNNSFPGTSDNRPESRDAKVDDEKFIRSEIRGGDSNEEIRNGRGPHMDKNVDNKMEKDSHLNWKDPKEQHRGSKYSETSGNGIDPWRSSRSSFIGASENVKEVSTTEVRNHSEAHETVTESKVDFKCDDRFKEKEKKRKDDKHRDGEERDMIQIEGNSLHPGNSSREHKELGKEERESERLERERKDHHKDNIKKDILNGDVKEYNVKELVDGSVRIPEQEHSAVENKRHKENENWKSAARKRDRDVDVEGDRHEKRNKSCDKESDDGCMEGDGVAEREKEKEVYGNGFQQRKRMLRPRGSPQISNREPRFRSRVRDNEELFIPGIHVINAYSVDFVKLLSCFPAFISDVPELSAVVYKVGEFMQEFMKLRKEFEASQDNKNEENSDSGPTLEIRIPAENVTATNRQVRGGQLWGTDIYTDDSDLVAVLMHTGYCRLTTSAPPSAIHEFRATIRVLPPQECYTSTHRNNVRSRAWGAGIGCSYRIEKCCIVKKGGGTINLEPCLTHPSSVEPTLAPMVVERSMTTRAAASNALRQQRFVKEVTIQYNLCNEPWIKYSISIVADKGLKKPMYTSARLKKGEVLYVETHSKRYELCFNGEKLASLLACQRPETETGKPQSHNLLDQNGERSTTNMGDRETNMVDVFRWSRCKKPLPQKTIRSIGFPLPLEHVEVLEENLDWEDIQWSPTGVWIAGKEYTLARVHFLASDKK
ncbi:hypothetical protein GIB67_026203 [Kingdonia uniflora]|uniref:Uncharacterized protein n=1 Tax=Kingdonia uniflora TaxID=39325 RepID=A0A7J7L9N2_9MAGN|nr:hypothetical protein GIB67_026203 [Kingdonia uniflora]